ncbi:MAG: DUF2905 domain-containing protein [Saprospiraceae bacterium]|nr:DUF2905 domain-containing protein [Saprospiraceae bacterium]
MDHTNTGRWMMLAGVILFLAGIVWYFLGSRIGRLPGDIRIEKEHIQIYIPLTTMLIISLIISLIIRLIRHW